MNVIKESDVYYFKYVGFLYIRECCVGFGNEGYVLFVCYIVLGNKFKCLMEVVLYVEDWFG